MQPDSRVLKVSSGFGGMSHPVLSVQGHQRVYCVNCGAFAGWCDVDLTGIIYICQKCEHVLGIPPLRQATHIPEPS